MQKISQVEYAGTWATNTANSKTTEGATFIHVERLSLNQYFVISFSNEQPFFTYVGGGFIRADGFLQITTDTGDVWIFTPAWVRGHKEALAMSDSSNEEVLGTYIRISTKFSTWPFPESVPNSMEDRARSK